MPAKWRAQRGPRPNAVRCRAPAALSASGGQAAMRGMWRRDGGRARTPPLLLQSLQTGRSACSPEGRRGPPPGRDSPPDPVAPHQSRPGPLECAAARSSPRLSANSFRTRPQLPSQQCCPAPRALTRGRHSASVRSGCGGHIPTTPRSARPPPRPAPPAPSIAPDAPPCPLYPFSLALGGFPPGTGEGECGPSGACVSGGGLFCVRVFKRGSALPGDNRDRKRPGAGRKPGDA